MAEHVVCPSCGFDKAEEGQRCPLCGATDVHTPTEGETLPMPRGAASTVARGRTADGTVYADRFVIEGQLGRGGMGQVLRVRDRADGSLRALKILLPGTEDDAGRVDRFRREIAVLSRIQHPAVPRVIASGTNGQELFFVCELVEGHDLKADVQKHGPWPIERACTVVATVADALGAAHVLGIVHRDLKPSNIMLGREGAVYLLDFGLARGAGGDFVSLTGTGTILGTPGYMSPEQFDGAADHSSDIYSLGVVLFELLTGRLPFTGQTPVQVAVKHKTEPPPPPRQLRADVPAWLDRVTLQCLAKDPRDRPSSASALAQELRKPRQGRSHLRRLPTGDAVLEDDAGSWALGLVSAQEKTGWATGMALRFEERYYKLGDVTPPSSGGGRWTYRFGFWPEGEVFRRLVDYAEDCAARAEERPGLGARLSGWLGRKDS